MWFLDAASAYNQIALPRSRGSSARWRCGGWVRGSRALADLRARAPRPCPPPRRSTPIPPGTDVDIEGSGEILKIAAMPSQGDAQRVTVDTGGITDGSLSCSLPSPYVVQRTGYQPRLVALTFDDGPDPDWTPQILDILKAKHVPATFFIDRRECADRARAARRGWCARAMRSATTPIRTPISASASARRDRVSSSTPTQRLFQAFTGRSLRLFRAPYFGDAEPTTADEIVPVAAGAESRLYLGRPACRSRGLEAARRPSDRRQRRSTASHGRRDASDELQRATSSCSTMPAATARRPSRRCRSIIDALRAQGYSFVPVSTLAGLRRDAGDAADLAERPLAARSRPRRCSARSARSSSALSWLFVFAISLGIARAVLLSALALIQARREERTRASRRSIPTASSR